MLRGIYKNEYNYRCDIIMYRLTPGSEAVLDIPEAVYYTARGASRGRYSK